MALKWRVRPKTAGANALSHPIDGPIGDASAGAEWTADQFTFRLIADGEIERVPDEPQPANRRAAMTQE